MGFLGQLYKLYLSPQKQYYKSLKTLTGIVPGNISVYQLAFQHSSASEETGLNNERLEYLGDAILDSVISEYLFLKYPYKNEGFLTEMRSKMVSRRQLQTIGDKLGLEELLQFNRQDKTINLNSLLGNCLEALIGAIYLDKGYSRTHKFIMKKIIIPFLDVQLLEKEERNFKSRIIEWAQKESKSVDFVVVGTENHNDKVQYEIAVKINGEIKGTGRGFNKKTAEQRASEVALPKLTNGDQA